MQTLHDLLSRAAHCSKERHLRLDREPLYTSFYAALVLLASITAGQNVDRISRLTGISRSFVARCARHLVDNGVWENGVVVRTWTPETATADPAFWGDVAVAEGKLLRRQNARGEIEWAAPGEWIKDYAFVRREAVGLGTLYHTRMEQNPGPKPGPPEYEHRNRHLELRPATAICTDQENAPTGEPPLSPERWSDPLRKAFPEACWLR